MRSKSSVILLVLAGLIVYNILGYITLNQQREEIAGRQGKVWTSAQAAVDKMPRLELYVQSFMSDRWDLIDGIATARNDILAAQKSGNLDDLDTAIGSLTNIKAVVEAYPLVDLSGLQASMMDEWAESIRQLKYARDQLIESQVGYNQTRYVFFPIGLVMERIPVLGENSNPAEFIMPTSVLQP